MPHDLVAMDERITAHVAAGAALLDREKENWIDSVDLETLDVCNPERCVLKQVFGDFIEAMEELGIEYGAPYGFDCRWGSCTQITQAWRELITARRAALQEGEQVAK